MEETIKSPPFSLETTISDQYSKNLSTIDFINGCSKIHLYAPVSF